MQGKYINCYKNLALVGKLMYKFGRYRQLGLAYFNQSVGLKMILVNRWIKKAEAIPWDSIEEKYAKLFPSKSGMSAKPLRISVLYRDFGVPDVGFLLCLIVDIVFWRCKQYEFMLINIQNNNAENLACN